MFRIVSVCPACNGAGTKVNGANPPDTSPCPACNTTGMVDTPAILRFRNGYLLATDILNATVISEYQALTSTQKELYQMILSMAVVNVGEGTNVRTLLMSMFDVGSQTRANIQNLLT